MVGFKMKHFNKIFQTLFIICILFLVSSTAEIFSKEKESKQPIEITAERMTSDQKSMKIIFIGNVVAIRDNLTISSDKMVVYNDEKSKKLEKIIAEGHVKIKKEKRFASGDRAVYIENEEKIILTGNPHAWEDGNKIIATEMIYLIGEDKFVVKGSKEKKIKLTLYPDKKNEKKK